MTLSEAIKEKDIKVKESKVPESKYNDWIYHCTNADSFLNILHSREFWMSNLEYVNDEDENNRINEKDYKGRVFVSCFTRNPIITNEFWEEYGTIKNGVLVSLKFNWLDLDSFPELIDRRGDKIPSDKYRLNFDKFKAISASEKMLPSYELTRLKYYKVIYDDNLIENIIEYGKETQGVREWALHYEDVAGIIKKTKGVSRKTGKMMSWKKEQEVRLKTVVTNSPLNEKISDDFYGTIWKLCVKLKDDAFNEFTLKFSPEFQNKEDYINEIKARYPSMKIHCEK